MTDDRAAGPFVLTVRLRVNPDDRRPLLAAARLNAAESLREPGCLRFDVIEDSAAPDRIVLHEIYRDRAAFEAHRSTGHFRRWRRAADLHVTEQVNDAGALVPPLPVAEPQVFRAAAEPVIDRGGGVRTVHLASGNGFMNGTTEFDPGASLPLHFHNCEESVVVLEGRARFECESQGFDLDAGDATWVPAGAAHRFINARSGTLRILWTYGRTDATRTYADTGETVVVERSTHRAED